MSKGFESLENTALYQLLGADGTEELRTKVIDMIVEEIHEQLHNSSDYIISPDDIAGELMNELMDEIREEVIEEYKDKVCRHLEEKMSALLE